ncbi:DUF4097 domain-containing protein [Paenibacillus sp. J5C_2022]|uniref:DUF4097 domain-containing protein n=1 Tax=Paenibacillus sp. J5C2022 TaxID=2977129 RepID=UPI0021D28D68|nr:DUF4097 domain-containing protein [Paenibacillus sp. J5C2022]MCU6712663.1 DUF4097 domain-containing protein [Paenibacillus sp. J5C2022]
MEELVQGKGKRSWLTALLAFLMPGLGHVYNGYYAKGLLIMSGLLLNFTAIFRLAYSDGGRHLLFIVYLGLLLPCFYFYSVYDALTCMDSGRTGERTGKRAITLGGGLMLLGTGALAMFLLKPPEALIPWMNELAELSVGPLLILSAVWLAVRSKGGIRPMFKFGRITAVLIMTAVGALLIWDQLQDRNAIIKLLEWWPVLFILLGLEMVLYSTIWRRRSEGVRIDAVGLPVALVVAVVAYSVTQYADYPARLLHQFNVDVNGYVEYGEERGFHYERPVMKVPADDSVSTIKLKNDNGDVVVRSGDARDIELHTAVWIDVTDQAEADAVAERTTVKASTGAEVVFQSDGQTYGASGSRKPRLNMELVVPRGIKKLEIQADNGSVSLGGMALERGALIKSNSGLVEVSNLAGPLTVQSKHGNIEAESISGITRLSTKNGVIEAHDIRGGLLNANSSNGSLELSMIEGDIEAETKNGEIMIIDAAASIKADTLNGGIHVSSPVVGADWDLDSSVGEIVLMLPEDGDYSVYGSVTFGKIKSELPLRKSRKTVRGMIGEGTYRIQINATNSITLLPLSENLQGAFIDKFGTMNVQ